MEKQTTQPEKLDPNFKIPDTSVTEMPNTMTQNIAFEKYKIRMNFYKWLMGTFCIAIITIAINWSFNDRAVGMSELSTYEKYATEVMVLNENPVKKRMLAQFFGTAAPSYFIRNRWKDYYDTVNEEYILYLKENKMLREKYKKLISIANPTDSIQFEIEYIKDKLDLNKIQEITPVVIPKNGLSTTVVSATISTSKSLAVEFEKKGFNALVNKEYNKALENFKNSYQIYPTLHNVEEIYKLLISEKPIDATDWKQLYTTILKQYSWGMPITIKKELEENLK